MPYRCGYFARLNLVRRVAKQNIIRSGSAIHVFAASHLFDAWLDTLLFETKNKPGAGNLIAGSW
jgi:hypothetical protein